MSHPTRQTGSSELLARYVCADREVDAEAALEELRDHIYPMIVASFRKDFRVSMRNGDGAAENQDALELASDAEVALIRKLRSMRDARESGEIGVLEAYVRTVTRNTFNQHLRRRRPVWTSLRNQIRYLLLKKPGLFLLKDPDGAWICGREGDSAEAARVTELTEARIEALRSERGVSSLSKLVESVLAIYGGTVKLDQLVSDIFALRKLSEPLQVDEDQAHSSVGSSEGDHWARAEQRELLEKLWLEIKRLPLSHRRVLLLNLTARSGESLIAELPLLRIASIQAIASALEFEAAAFAELWPRLPLVDSEIAERLGLSRQQVVNLRHSARSSLKKRMGIQRR